MFNDLIFPAFIMTSDGVALDTEATSGDNPITAGLQLSDRLRRVMTDAGKLRVVVSV